MPTKAFIKSRKEGKIGQAYVAGMFRSWGLTVREIGNGYHPDYDLEVTGEIHGNPIHFYDEVKWDKKHLETGNIYLDINSLSKSKAGILTICTGKPIDTVYMLELKSALDYAINSPYKKRGGEYGEESAAPPLSVFIQALKPKILTIRSYAVGMSE